MGNGASEGIRTLDTHVGNVMLYQAELRSLPAGNQVMRISAECKNGFEIIFHHESCNSTFRATATAHRSLFSMVCSVRLRIGIPQVKNWQRIFRFSPWTSAIMATHPIPPR